MLFAYLDEVIAKGEPAEDVARAKLLRETFVESSETRGNDRFDMPADSSEPAGSTADDDDGGDGGN